MKKLKAEIDGWNDREQLLQFELHLTGKADVLPMEVIESYLQVCNRCIEGPLAASPEGGTKVCRAYQEEADADRVSGLVCSRVRDSS